MNYLPTKTSLDSTTGKIPPLEQGDHLTRDEFERRYEAMPELQKAELIEGVVYMPSPVRYLQHSSPYSTLNWWLKHYAVFTPGVGVGGDATIRLDLDNEPQPDAIMIREPSHGGRVIIDSSGYLQGAPELVGEIAASSASIDLHTKMRVYRRNGVQEYIVWRVEDSAIDWFSLKQGDYARLQSTSTGIYQSEIFPGLWLDAAALVRGDSATVLRVLQEGIACPEHGAYVADVEKCKK